MNGALAALRQLGNDYATTPDEIWDDHIRPHVDGIHQRAVDEIKSGIEAAERNSRGSPMGVPIVGQRGVGKTHLIGQARRLAHDAGGYFFRVNITTVDDFWPNLIAGYLDGLSRGHPSDQLSILLNRLADWARVDADVRDRLLTERRPSPAAVDAFTQAMSQKDRATVQETHQTVRALLLLAAGDIGLALLADSYLRGNDGVFDPDGLFSTRRTPALPPKKVVRDISWLLALTGPSVIAVDQIDEIVTTSRHGTDTATADESNSMLDMLGGGLMELRENTRRTVALVSSLPGSWTALREHCTGTVGDRFRDQVLLYPVTSAQQAEALITATLRPRYEATGFEPPYPTYPITPSCLDGAVGMTPRQILRKVSDHVEACVKSGEVTELADFGTGPRREPAPIAPGGWSEWDRKFTLYRDAADIATAKHPSTEDSRMPQLLRAGLLAWIAEDPHRDNRFRIDPPPGARASLHARLRREGESGHEEQWTFRAIGHNVAQSVLNRVKNLMQASGLGQLPDRHAVLWITADDWGKWDANTKTQRTIEDFIERGDVIMAEDEDLRVFAALERLGAEGASDYADWLRARRPAGRTALFRAVFGSSEGPGPDESAVAEPLASAEADSSAVSAQTVEPQAAEPESTSPEQSTEADEPVPVSTQLVIPRHPDTIHVGRDVEFDEPVELSLRSLCKHVSVFAGSGSGKTVFLRRLIEECALRGVSSIVLDPNNDLSRLGQAWPQAPETWWNGDFAAAKEYLDNTDVRIWTPGRRNGRPLSFQPLPDFAAVVDDEDEFSVAVDTAANALAPRALIDKSTTRNIQRRAVLKEALTYFGRYGGVGFEAFLQLLEDLPDAAGSLNSAAEMAAELAETLRAVRVDDRLFAGEGAFDPGDLLTPPDGKRARVSVVNFSGLPSESGRQGFVNQLQMALFSWLKRNPAKDQPLVGLLVMDEAQTLAPSVGRTVCTGSTLALVAQARKYGLGMVFATQAPKGIHNQIVGNSATHLYGRLTTQVQVAAAESIAENKGGVKIDIARLKTGRFYAVREGEQTCQIATPMCLTHHPATAPTSEDILRWSRELE